MKDAILTWRTTSGATQKGSFFDALAMLSAGAIDTFPALRPHQAEPWHAFCVQVAVIALATSSRTDIPQDAQIWRDLLIRTTPQWPDGEAWSLVVEDPSKPALLQAPIDINSRFPKSIATPDGIDILVTGRNHEMKQSVIRDHTSEDWLFSLVTLQTAQGHLGTGNFGISRMNSGTGTRVMMRIKPPGGASASFIRDVRALLARGVPPSTEGHPAFLWTLPWDGETSLHLDALHPNYVEICRRIRLSADQNGNISARTWPSKVTRIEGNLKGVTGCPWTPIDPEAKKMVTPSAAGYDLRNSVRHIDRSRTERPYLCELNDGDPSEGLAYAITALRREQGKTPEMLIRRIPIPPLGQDPKKSLEAYDKNIIARQEDVSTVSGVLNVALMGLSNVPGKQIKLDDQMKMQRIRPWRLAFDQGAENIVFGAGVEPDTPEERKRVRKDLTRLAREILRQASDALPRAAGTTKEGSLGRSISSLHSMLAKKFEEVNSAL